MSPELHAKRVLLVGMIDSQLGRPIYNGASPDGCPSFVASTQLSRDPDRLTGSAGPIDWPDRLARSNEMPCHAGGSQRASVWTARGRHAPINRKQPVRQ
jgi:hypothetical protein